MKIFKAIAGRIWATWGLITFVATFLVIFLPSMATYLMPEPTSSRVFYFLSRVWMRIWLTLVACPLRIRGEEHVEKGVSYIFTCNHNSLLDIPLSSPFIPGANKTIAKTSFARIPLFGWYYRKGSVLVDRNSEGSRRRSFDQMKKVLRAGFHMCIYPEGTRNRTNQPMKKFYDGAFRLAIDTKTAVVPTVIFNTRKAVPADKGFFFLPHTLSIHFLPPVSPINKTAEELNAEVHGLMSEYFSRKK